MRPHRTTLVMAGAREAHGIITALLSRRRDVIASLPEPERVFGALPVKTRVGGFDGEKQFADWISENDVATVIDAGHCCDSEISKMVSAVCTHLGLRYLRVLRPQWRETARDKWRYVPSVRQASAAVPADGRVFSNTGWPTLVDYSNFKGAVLFMRQTHEPTGVAPYDFVRFVPGNPPFSQFQEQQLFERLRITHLICRNVGGAASMSKLLAARALNIPVIMVSRDEPPAHQPVVETVAEAVAWEANQ